MVYRKNVAKQRMDYNREKGRDLTQSYEKSPYTHRKRQYILLNTHMKIVLLVYKV